MKFARYVFAIAGIYGVLVLVPQYFMLDAFGQANPPAVTHAEFYYGFTGVALAFQIVFLIIATDPPRYRPMMLASIAEKLTFAIAVGLLLAEGHTPSSIAAGAGVDLVLAVLFAVSYFKTPVE